MTCENLTYQLYAYPNTYAFGVHLMLEESGVPYRIINPKVNPSLTNSDFHHASPHARVPALILPNGITMCESSAIAMHLAESLSNQAFSVDAASADRTRYLQWLFYLSSTLQPDVMIVFHPEHYFPDDVRQSALIIAAKERLDKVWEVLEHEYSNKDHQAPWMFEHGPTAVDFSLATVLLWQEVYPGSLQKFPALDAMLLALEARPSFKRITPWHKRMTNEAPSKLVAGS